VIEPEPTSAELIDPYDQDFEGEVCIDFTTILEYHSMKVRKVSSLATHGFCHMTAYLLW